MNTDYLRLASDTVINESGVAGVTVSDALDTLESLIATEDLWDRTTGPDITYLKNTTDTLVVGDTTTARTGKKLVVVGQSQFGSDDVLIAQNSSAEFVAQGFEYGLGVHRFSGSAPGVIGPVVAQTSGRGTPASPAQTLDGDVMGGFQIAGVDDTPVITGSFESGILVRAAENWTSAAQGTELYLMPTPAGTATAETRGVMSGLFSRFGDQSAALSTAPSPPGQFSIVNDQTFFTPLDLYNYQTFQPRGSQISQYRSAGLIGTPAGIAAADYVLGGVEASGMLDDNVSWGTPFSGLYILSEETFTSLAQGTRIELRTIPNGSTTAAVNVVVKNDGKIGFGTPTPHSTVDINGSFSSDFVSTGLNITLNESNHVVNCTTGGTTVTLPTAVGILGREYIVKNSAGSGDVTVDADGTETIDGNLTDTITPDNSRTFRSDGSNWITI